MASRAIYGKPGGGKSYWSTAHVILGELLESERVIVTNVVLRMEAWVPYLVSIGRSDVDFFGRVLLIGDDNLRLNAEYTQHGDEEVKNFWRFRGHDSIVDPLTEQQIKDGQRPEIVDGKGVHYVLDELHEHLNSRQWMKTGPLLLWYIAKHRHYGDDVTWITQSVPNVDKQWRSVTQDYTLVRNYGKEHFRGFRKGNKFEAVTFLEYDANGSLTPQNSETFKLDLEKANLYYTSVKGGEADKGHKAKGLHVAWIYAGVVAICIALSVAFITVPGWVGKKMGQSVEEKSRKEAPRLVQATAVQAVPANGAPLETPALQKDLSVVAVPLKYVAADRVLAAFGAGDVTGSKPWLVPSANNSSVIVQGYDFQAVVAFAEAVKEFDGQSALVTVEAVVARLVKGKGTKTGLYDFMKTAANSTGGGFGQLLDSFAWDASTGVVSYGTIPAARYALQAVTDFQSTGYTFTVFSRPSVTVLGGSSAEFASGRQVPVPVTVSNQAGTQTSVQYKEAEFVFKVSPTVLPGGRVRLEIEQSNSDVLSTAEVGGNPIPTLTTQRLKTYVDLEPGQVGYLGGLTYTTARDDRRGVPILGDIPGLSLIFGTKDKGEETGELVLFVTVSYETGGYAGPPIRKAIPVSGSDWDAMTSTISAAPQPETQNGKTKGKTKQKKK